jgi:NAD+ diphosphatase
MVQDIYPHIFQNEFTHKPVEDHDYVLIYQKDTLLMDTTSGIRLPTYAELAARDLASPNTLQYLFAEDGVGYYLLETPAPEPFGSYTYVTSRTYRDLGPMEALFACAVGETLNRWYGGNHFCGRCGKPMEKSKTERAMVCPDCGNTVYPKICPAVIVAVCDGDRLLLTKYAGRSFQRYALIAGFAEIGESIENTVRREVMEEVGLHLGELRFYKSQPWVFTDTLLMGFYAKLEGSDTIHLQEDELSVGEWFHRKDLPDDHSGISLTGEMIETFRLGQDPFSMAGK